MGAAKSTKSAGVASSEIVESGEMVTASALGQLLDISYKHVHALTKDGILAAKKKGDRLYFDKDANVTRYVQYLHAQLANKQKGESTAETEARKAKADADWKRSRADMAALQLAELEGKMHRSEDVAAVTGDIVLSLRSLLTAMPGRLAMDVANKTTAEASEIIRADVNNMLYAMSGYSYDPDAYRQRVRERVGWEAGQGGQEGEGDDGDGDSDGE